MEKLVLIGLMILGNSACKGSLITTVTRGEPAKCDDGTTAASAEECEASTAEESKVAIKLQSDDCVDPDLSLVSKATKLMLCDGTMAEGKLDLSGVSAENIKTGVKIGSITGTLTPSSLADCSSDAQIDCKANASFKAADASKLTAGNIKRGITIGGVEGEFPSSAHPLPRFQSGTGSDATTTAAGGITTDLTNFVIQLTSAGSFEYWDKNGQRYTGSGDSDIADANVKNGVDFENVGVNGSYTGCGGTYPAAGEVENGVQYGPTGTDFTGTKRDIKLCKNGKGITASGGDTTTPWDDGETNGDDSIDDQQNNASPRYTGASRSNCNEGNFTDVTGGTNLVPDDAKRVTAGGGETWDKIFQDDLTGLYFTNVLANDGVASELTWTEALDLCAGLDGGTAGSGWRLPTQKELMQLHIDGISRLTTFGNLVQYFWSSSSVSFGATNAWYVYLSGGFTSNGNKTDTRAVACVRE